MALTRPRYSQIYDTDYKQSVRLATTTDVGNLLISGNITSSVDSITVTVNDRILVKDQVDARQNGIYRVVTVGSGTDGTWIRALDADANDKVTSGMTTTISEGTSNSGKTFKLGTADPIVLGTSELTFINPFAITATAAGSNTYVQFNDTGSILGASPGFTFNKASNVLTVSGNISATYVLGDGSQLTGVDATSIQNSGTIVKTYSNGNITITGNLVPSANVTYNLGSPTQRWATGYFAGNTLDLGGAQISINPSTGVFSFVSIHSTTTFGGSSTFNPQGNVNIGGDLIVSGAVYVAGNTTTISTSNVVFNDALIYLADGNPTDFLDIGFIGNFTRSALYSHTGFARDATDGVWKLFEGVEPEPTTVIDFGSASYATALIGNLVTRSNITVGGNIKLGKALLTSAGLGGDPGQYLISTGTGIAWTNIDFSTVTDGGNTTITAEASNVNISINTTAVASFGETSLNITGDVYATQFIGNGSQLTGLPAGYSNVQVATYLPTYSGILGSSNLQVTGGGTFSGTLTVGASGVINSGGNILATAGTLNSLTVNGNITVGNIFPTANNVSNIGSASSTFRIIHAQATQAQYADLAEVYTSDQQYPAGTVVVFGGDAEVTQSRASHDTRIAGVVSTNPAYLMNSTETGVPVALQGRVPCRVLGPVIQGDRIVSSHIAGVARALDPLQYQPGCIIGKALQAVDSTDISIIEVVVGRV